LKTKDFLGNQWDIDCMACAVSRGSISVPGGLIHRGRYFFVQQDSLIPLPGFLVIASLRHIRSLSEMQPAEYDDFSRLLRTTHHAIKEVTKVDCLTLVQEEKSPHFHLWFFPWTDIVIQKYGQPSLSKIRGIMEDYRNMPLGRKEWQELAGIIERIRSLPDWGSG
jgi:diadenosine tetraphosphate (Ap4A) HIT family hydrolase